MIALWLLLASAPAAEQRLGFDRLDLIAADPGTWLNYDLPMVGVATTQTAVRFLEQVQPVWSTPVDGLYVGTSLASQSLVYEHPVADFFDREPLWLPDGVYVYGGVQSALFLPRGLVLGGAWRTGIVRTGLGLSVLSNATWRRPDYGHWHVLPTLSVGFGPIQQP